jgi:hypothetical protein
MGFYKDDSDGRKSTLFPTDGNKNDDTLWANEKGLVTKAGGCGNPDADPEILVCQGGLDDAWGTAHLMGFEWKRDIRSKDKHTWNSEATILPEGYSMEQYLARVRIWDYSWNTGDWRGSLLACTAHFSEPVWITSSGVGPRIKISSNLGGGFENPNGGDEDIYLYYKNTDMYANDYINDVVEPNGFANLDDEITSFTITNGGSGYTAPPEISFSDSGSPQAELPAVASAMIIDGVVAEISINFGGKGYSAIPGVVFDNTGTGGSGAAATANIIDRGDGTYGMTHQQYRNSYLYPNGSSSITFAMELPMTELPSPLGFDFGTGSAFSIPENAIDLNGLTITEGTSAGGANAVITNSASRGSSAGGVTVFHQTGEIWVYI